MPSGGVFDVASRERRIAELDGLAASPDFWNDNEQAQKILKERAEAFEPLDAWRKYLQSLDDAKVFVELAGEGDDDAATEADTGLDQLQHQLDQLELEQK